MMPITENGIFLQRNLYITETKTDMKNFKLKQTNMKDFKLKQLRLCIVVFFLGAFIHQITAQNPDWRRDNNDRGKAWVTDKDNSNGRENFQWWIDGNLSYENGTNSIVSWDGGIKLMELSEKALEIRGPVYIGNIGNGRTGDNNKSNFYKISSSVRDSHSLFVEKGIVSEDYALSNVTTWRDDVFKENYNLPKIEEVYSFIKKNKHLPNFPSEAEVLKKGYSLHDINMKLLGQVEEMMLYIINQQSEIEILKKEIRVIKTRN